MNAITDQQRAAVAAAQVASQRAIEQARKTKATARLRTKAIMAEMTRPNLPRP